MRSRGLVLTKDGRVIEGNIEVRAGHVTVSGWLRRRIGPDWRRVEYVAEGRWTFPMGRVREVRHRRAVA